MWINHNDSVTIVERDMIDVNPQARVITVG